MLPSQYNSRFTYTIIDGARVQQQMHKAKEINPNHLSLYKGRSEEYLNDVGPHLFTYDINANFVHLYENEGWGNAWGILLKSNFSFEKVYTHFRNFYL